MGSFEATDFVSTKPTEHREHNLPD